jgi:hypothetical protein
VPAITSKATVFRPLLEPPGLTDVVININAPRTQ